MEHGDGWILRHNRCDLDNVLECEALDESYTETNQSSESVKFAIAEPAGEGIAYTLPMTLPRTDIMPVLANMSGL